MATHASRSQISKSLAGVMTDPASAEIPFDAWRNVDQLSISVATLKLQSTEDLDDAKTLLHKLDLSKLLKMQAQELQASGQSESAFQRPNDLKGSGATPSPGSEEPSLQLKVFPRGLGTASRRSEMFEATGLNGRLDGNAKALFSLRRQISRLFAKYQSKRTMVKGQPNDLTFSIMSSYLLQAKAHASKAENRTVKRFDVRQLCDRYQDIVWAKNVLLEKICLSEIAAKDMYGHKRQLVGRAVYRDIASVALPGAPASPSITSSRLKYAPAKLGAPWPTEIKAEPKNPAKLVTPSSTEIKEKPKDFVNQNSLVPFSAIRRTGSTETKVKPKEKPAKSVAPSTTKETKVEPNIFDKLVPYYLYSPTGAPKGLLLKHKHDPSSIGVGEKPKDIILPDPIFNFFRTEKRIETKIEPQKETAKSVAPSTTEETKVEPTYPPTPGPPPSPSSYLERKRARRARPRGKPVAPPRTETEEEPTETIEEVSYDPESERRQSLMREIFSDRGEDKNECLRLWDEYFKMVKKEVRRGRRGR